MRNATAHGWTEVAVLTRRRANVDRWSPVVRGEAIQTQPMSLYDARRAVEEAIDVDSFGEFVWDSVSFMRWRLLVR